MAMSGEILYVLPDLDNVTDVHIPFAGWVSSSRDRGSIDIMWSCCLTIVLCCWVATHPNAGAPGDKWYHAVLDKFHLAMIGFLGPDFLLGIAVGQLSSARRSVKRFKKDKHLLRGEKWTLQYGFFADMGGFHLASPDFAEGFPVNAEQLHYLVKHGHVEFPNMSDMMISERNTTDTLSRVITAWQVTWFSVAEFQRVGDGLPMTTLELTALSFVPMMLATTICWYSKPSIISPRILRTRNGKSVEEIRTEARQSTHPNLPVSPDDWYRTPLDFIGHYRWGIGTHWAYYTGLAEKFHLRIVSRPNKNRLWARYPSDLWLPPDASVLPFLTPVMLAFSISFTLAWNFYFPSVAEQMIWRASSIYHAFFSIYGGLYYLFEAIKWNRRKRAERSEQLSVEPRPSRPPSPQDDVAPLTRTPTTESFQSDAEAQAENSPAWFRRFRLVQNLEKYVASFRNVSLNQDPQMALALRLTAPVTVTCVIYIYCRLYLYVEDFISFRMQPIGVYITVNRFLPFIGD